MALFNPEVTHLLHKRRQNPLKPVEILLSTVVGLLAFVDVFQCAAFRLRYSSWELALMLGPGLCALVTAILGLIVVYLRRRLRHVRGVVTTALCLIIGAVVGGLAGDSAWINCTSKVYTWQDMASYVNIDPARDQASSYMDAGMIYFKDGSHVLSDKALAFRNGATYCVAPIVRQPIFVHDILATPESGTVDFWAVGTDCCGEKGTDAKFTCGEAATPFSRSGLRILGNTERQMYLLATQEWSASTAVPAKHPLFVSYVKDPVQTSEDVLHMAWYRFWSGLTLLVPVQLVASLLIHMALQAAKVL
mmetsp:Transcript_68872/g.149887  ORF Transcript_68872/g.149887 Transcript_68872/m.149887 type:complete len:305 (-) Transcript_68872:129-1043(-)|eukprot:CAMPEP_0170603712 /NCGR_PEP_ID=MMETSP0224-20130122/19053_1 /TAXON_ID=285029 /ORGANISM="Togula jolla, Strain CCCM 725" /LENGTH=304 /DNA_ID=CAMNT_0010928601 /DNA_START=61 /DNA_END=975 /DNA_ORIENTATION=+